MNIFDVDVDRVKALVESEPWVASVRVERRLPNRLSVDVTEWEPAGVLVSGATWHLIDRHGNVFKALEPTDPVDSVLGLPFVTGIEENEAKSEVSKELLVEALDLVDAYRRLGLHADYPLSEVHVDRVMGLSLVPENGVEIRLGRGRYQERLKRLGVVLATLEAEGRDADYILIDQEEDLSRVTVGQRTQGTDASGPLHN
jgi:cell division protein FtsQ